MKKLSWKHRILFSLITGVVYGIMLMVVNTVLGIGIGSVGNVFFQAIFFGITFGFGFPYFMQKIASKIAEKVENPLLDDDENIIMEEGANLFRSRWIAVGGKLFLTDKRLIFNSHKYNLQNGQTSIDLIDIEEVIERKTSRIIDNGLRILTKDNSKYDFVMNNRNELVNQLRNCVQL